MTRKKILKLLKFSVVGAVLLLTTNCVFGSFYFQGGGSFWREFDVRQITRSGIPIDRPQQTSVVRRIDVWLGAGYALNEDWHIEAFFARLPTTNAFSQFDTYYRGILLPGAGGTINLSTETAMIGVGGGYEFALNEQILLFGKLGVAYAQNDSELDLFSQSFAIPINAEDIFDFDRSDLTVDIEDLNFDKKTESTLDLYFAVGVRIPLLDSNTSVTATYQFVSTSTNIESGLFVGLRWDL